MKAILDHLEEYNNLSPEQTAKVVLDYLKSRLPESTQMQLEMVAQDVNIQDLLHIWFAAVRPPLNLKPDLLAMEQALIFGIGVDVANSMGETAMHIAAWWSRPAVAKFLIDHGASAHLKDTQGRTPIDIATCTNSDRQLVKILYDNRAELDIYSACFLGKLEVVKAILRDNLGLAYAPDWFSQETPLHKAARGGSLKTVHLLLKAGADVMACNLLDTTSLHVAAQSGHLPVIELLLGHQAEINAKDKQGATPLDYAVHNGGGQPDVVSLLRANGGKQYIETRSIPWPDFIDCLEQYYADKDCTLEVEMADDGAGLDTYNIHPNGKSYFMKKVRGGQEVFSQDEALAEIKTVFFPNEPVIVRDISQWHMFPDEPIDLLIELPEGF